MIAFAECSREKNNWIRGTLTLFIPKVTFYYKLKTNTALK